MHSIKDIFTFLYTQLLSYYQNNQLAYFVTNQLIKLELENDYLIVDKNYIPSHELINLFKKYIYNITILHMPYQYILKEIPFCNSTITIKPPVLIPRVETEELVNWIMQKLNSYKNDHLTIVDFCSGSGCIGIALLDFFKNSTCTAFDICHESVGLSSYNAQINNVKKRYTIHQKDIFKLKKNNKYNIIISNPPYISSIDYKMLDNSVKLWEHKHALTDQASGYRFILYLLKISRQKLKDNGLITIELCDSYADFILEQAKKIYTKELVFLWLDQYNKKRAIIIARGKYTGLFCM